MIEESLWVQVQMSQVRIEMQKITIKTILNYLNQEEIPYKFKGNENEDVEGFSTLFNYKYNTLTFVSSLNNFHDYKESFDNVDIKLIIISTEEKIYEPFKNIIQTSKPKSLFFKILAYFFNEPVRFNEGKLNKTYPNSYVSESAKIGDNVKIGIGCVIEEGAVIGANTLISHNVIIKSNAIIGDNCTIFAGAVIGERGFNPSTTLDGSKNMLEHYGGVIIEDDVHIGENSVIVRGAIDDTIVKRGTKLNTMVHVAHNCYIGENTVISMPTHVSGSVTIGKNCHIAATTIRNQCTLGDNATLGLGSVVVKDVDSNTTVIGNPARPMNK